ncbi:MAG TPA: class IV adenylate cyclase [Candidatus Hodarchaeales archaeon]|nr:class IV adenylate cyclase [Candidatus Hodarchaeales archaeon]
MEIEVRARINDASKIKDLLQTKAEFVESSNENDLYLRHESDVERSLVLRIRRKENGSFLTFKGKSKGDDTAWPDVDLPLSHPDDLENLLLGSDYIEVVRINKHRSTYREQDFEINLDEIDNLGSFIEIEGRGTDSDRTAVEEKITKFLIDLGIQKSNIIRKGYVTLMLEKVSSSHNK